MISLACRTFGSLHIQLHITTLRFPSRVSCCTDRDSQQRAGYILCSRFRFAMELDKLDSPVVPSISFLGADRVKNLPEGAEKFLYR